ncbi:MAG TPA: 50S ribosomal protein L29 [Acidimicrobiia bacterium]|jgi:large subunit ribosomal protein L29|nr:50S ribosomal protein L29 [Acidimicrobiia bacterium]
MSVEDLRELKDDELMEALLEAKEERFNLRFQVATNQLDNTARLKTVKKEIARILTVMREREMEGAAAAAASEESA